MPVNYVVSPTTEILFVEAGSSETANANPYNTNLLAAALDVKFVGFEEQLESLQEVL